ncbi:MAG TPA: histidine kinase dimerization/phospho-acceptor domain-containing protein, partial [Pseudolysinimonas sp.]|nr:histidine kinase dimerization/phospho-acceptor domain-containing protein [Pseudolysinimonas sp.]
MSAPARMDPLTWLGGEHRPLPIRQLPTTLAFAAALVVMALSPTVQVTDSTAVIAGIVSIILASAAVLVFGRWAPTSRWSVIVPVVSLMAIGELRTGTGGPASLFGAMLVLPVVWIASLAGRRYIAVAAVTCSVALYGPYLVERLYVPDTVPVDIPHGIYTPLVYALVAIAVNELARRARDQVSRLRESEERARASARMTRSVLDAVTEQGVIGTRLDGTIDVWNPGATMLLGVGPEETVGRRSILDFHLPSELDDRRRELRHGGEVLALPVDVLVESTWHHGYGNVREWTFLRAGGSRVPVEVSVTSRLEEEGGEPVGYLFVATDMTRAHDTARAKDEFVAQLSHELRTPLSSILGYLDLVRDDPTAPLTEEQERYVGVAERNALRLLRLAGDLVFTAQADAGALQELAPLGLNAVVDAAIESAEPASRAAGIAVIAQLPHDSP